MYGTVPECSCSPLVAASLLSSIRIVGYKGIYSNEGIPIGGFPLITINPTIPTISLVGPGGGSEHGGAPRLSPTDTTTSGGIEAPVCSHSLSSLASSRV